MRAVAMLVTAGLMIGCGADGFETESLGEVSEPIINGQPDPGHDQIIACFSNNAACSATLIHHDGSFGYALTAAHCMFSPNNPNQLDPLVQCAGTDDYQGVINWVANVSTYQVHPDWDTNQLIYDFAMLRLNGVPSNAPVMPPATPAEDNITNGTMVQNVGFGSTQPGGGGMNSVRRRSTNVIEAIFQIQIQYDQDAAGPCSGDSGGASIHTTANGERVAGVISFVDQNCTDLGVSGRVSAVHPWIVAFTGQTTTTTASSTAQSTAASTGAGGNGAGGGSTAAAGAQMTTDAAAAGTGGATTNNGGPWNAAGQKRNKIEGATQTTGCSTGGSRSSDLWLTLLALMFAVRRRRS